ncbi:MAG: cation:proton antiporter [Lentisphaeria bacterium]|nr:cation:proton antiporter [Lentisphaeria bacterium]
MALGIAEIILLGLLADWLARKARVPGLLGLLVLGILMGPYVLGFINAPTQAVAADLRLIALVVILLRSGFEISREALAKVGGRALLMAFIPCLCEVAVITVAAPLLLGLTHVEAAILGSVLAAVSPAVVVPLMIRFIQEGKGAERAVPTLVLAGASCDDAVAIVLSGAFVGLYTGGEANLVQGLMSVPVSVVTGAAVGLAAGFLFYHFFKRFNPRATKRVLIILGCSILLLQAQPYIERVIPFSALIATMGIGFIILEICGRTAHELSLKLGKIWLFAELLLFTLVGAQVNLPVAWQAGFAGAGLIAIGLAGRCCGVQLCLFGSAFTLRERLFITLAYLPKATVQAAIGATPLLAMRQAGMPAAPGEIILAIAVLSIILTAPAGAFLIAWGGNHLLDTHPETATSSTWK